MVFEKVIRYIGPAVELMVFEKLICSAGLAVGLKPSARECEARLRGRERSMYSKTILPAQGQRGRDARAPRCAGYPRCEQVRARGEGFAMVAPREGCALKRAGVTQSPSGGVEGLQPSTNRLLPARDGRAVGVSPGRLT